MKQTNIISKLYLSGLSATLFLLPFAMHLTIYSLAFWFVTSIVFFLSKPIKTPNKQERITFIGLLLFYIVMFVSAVFSQNQGHGFNIVSAMLPIGIAAFSVYAGKETIITNIRFLMLMLFAGATVSSLILILNATFGIYNPANFTKPERFSYEHFSLFLHPSYAGLLLNLTITIALDTVLFRLKFGQYFKKITLILLIGLWSFTVFLLSARIGLITLIAAMLIQGIVFLFTSKISVLYRIGVVLLLGLSTLLIFKNERFYKKTKEITQFFDKKDISSKSIREVLWENALKIGAYNPIFGCGIGDVNEELDFRNPDPKGVFNAHNQFLEFFAGTGLIGLITFLFLFIQLIFSIVKSKRLNYYLLLTVFLLSFLVESILVRFSGAVFFGIFLSFMIFLDFKNEKSNNFGNYSATLDFLNN